MDEQLLIDGCMRGESWARKELYEQYAPAMMSVCMRYVGDRETARDLLQDGFVKIFTKIRSYSGSGAFPHRKDRDQGCQNAHVYHAGRRTRG